MTLDETIMSDVLNSVGCKSSIYSYVYAKIATITVDQLQGDAWSHAYNTVWGGAHAAMDRGVRNPVLHKLIEYDFKKAV